MAKEKKVYALLVGINKYPKPISRLRGCLNDVAAVKDYLENLEEISLKTHVLADEKATKLAIVEGFEQFLSQAQKDEVALFYFSGHGTREKAAELFWKSDPDQKLQCLIPYDGVVNAADGNQYNLLANKELRYLINQLSKSGAHVLTIFDSCHSGGASRDLGSARARQYLPGSSDKASFPMRKWEDFIFSSSIDEKAVADQPYDEWLPEGAHIHLAAALPHEQAYEIKGQGIFTRKLLELLKYTGAKLTYTDLQSLIRNYVKQEFKQTPQVYASKGNSPLQYFLDLVPKEQNRSALSTGTYEGKLRANVSFLKSGWQMDVGTLQGVSDEIKEVEVFSENHSYVARIHKIRRDTTLLKFDGKAPDEDQYCWAFVKQHFNAPIKVHINNLEDDQQGLDFIKAKLKTLSLIKLVKKGFQADYSVYVADGQYQITLPDDPKRPLVAAVSPYSPYAARRVAGFLKHISRWEFVKNLHNPNAFLFKAPPIKVEIIGSDGKVKELQNDLIEMEYERIEGELTGKFKIKLTNQYHERLYVSFLYLSMNFQVYAGLLPQGAIGIEPGKSAWVDEGDYLELDYEEQVEAHNWPFSTTYFKLIASTVFMDVNALEMDALPSPLEGIKRAGREEAVEEEPESKEDWITRLLCLQLRNPNYKEGE